MKTLEAGAEFTAALDASNTPSQRQSAVSRSPADGQLRCRANHNSGALPVLLALGQLPGNEGSAICLRARRAGEQPKQPD
jgi:hypothetical protein